MKLLNTLHLIFCSNKKKSMQARAGESALMTNFLADKMSADAKGLNSNSCQFKRVDLFPVCFLVVQLPLSGEGDRCSQRGRVNYSEQSGVWLFGMQQS